MPYNLPNGQYPFPLNFLASDGGDDTTAFVANDPFVEDVSNNWYVLCLTPDELLDLISVIEVGAPIAFPDTYNTITQKYMQMREFPNEIPGDSCMDLCQLIIDCINDTPGLQLLIEQEAIGAGVDGDTVADETIEATNLIGDIAGCDNDLLFGFSTGFVDFLNGTAVDIIEVWNDAVNAAARIGDLIEAIPIIGEAPFDDILQMTETFLQDLADNYAAAYTNALRDEYRCDLFCLAQDDCNLSVLDVFDYFNDRLTVPVVISDVNSFIAVMLTQPSSGTELVDAFNMFILASIQFGSNVLDIDIDRLVKVLSALFNDPDSDWVGLCDECEWTEDYLNGNGNPLTDGWVADKGSYNAGTNELDWEVNGGSTRSIVIRYVFTGNATLTEISINGRTFMEASSRGEVISIYDDDDTLMHQEFLTVDSTPNNQDWTVLLENFSQFVQADWYIKIDCNTVATPSFPNGTVFIEDIQIKGTGTNPF